MPDVDLRDLLKQAQRACDGYQVDFHHGEGNDGQQALNAVEIILPILDAMITEDEEKKMAGSVKNAIYGIMTILESLAKRVDELERANGWKGLKL